MIAGAQLLDELDLVLAGYVRFPTDEARQAVTLWVAHCHAIDAFESTPRLAILSPEKGSGKTRVLEVLELYVPTPIRTVNMSAAALYRVVDDKNPTLLLDESDTYLGNAVAKQHEDLRGLINAGHRRGAVAYRGEVSGKSVDVVAFKAFAACALAGIGDIPDTILDRSIVIGMKRRAPNEAIAPFRERTARAKAATLHAQLEAWAVANLDELREAWPTMPEGIVDRAADVWEPLLAVADAAGGHWPDTARNAAVTLNNARAQRDPSLGVLLLTDCRRVFTARAVDRLMTAELLDALHELDESPWADLRGKPLEDRGLARRLSKYEIRPAHHRFGDITKRGYLREDFHDAWTRYLPAEVTDVTDVTDAQEHREATDEPPLQVADLLSISDSAPLSSNGGPKQAKQPQHEIEWLEKQAEAALADEAKLA